jgi:hypothetical protein
MCGRVRVCCCSVGGRKCLVVGQWRVRCHWLGRQRDQDEAVCHSNGPGGLACRQQYVFCASVSLAVPSCCVLCESDAACSVTRVNTLHCGMHRCSCSSSGAGVGPSQSPVVRGTRSCSRTVVSCSLSVSDHTASWASARCPRSTCRRPSCFPQRHGLGMSPSSPLCGLASDTRLLQRRRFPRRQALFGRGDACSIAFLSNLVV